MGCRGRRLDRKAELRFEARRAQHAYRILAIARLRIPDEAQRARGDVLRAVHVVPEREVRDVVIERVRREVAPPDILVDRAVDVIAQDATRGVEATVGVRVIVVHGSTRTGCCADGLGRLDVGGFVRAFIKLGRLAVLGVGLGQRLIALRRRGRGAKRCHLDDVAAEKDVSEAKAPADEPAVAEQPLASAPAAHPWPRRSPSARCRSAGRGHSRRPGIP